MQVPHLSEDSQTGGAMSTRGTKRSTDDGSPDVKELKPEVKQQEENEEYDEGPTPLFVANVTKLGPAKRWKQNFVVNQKFTMTLDQQRSPKESEDLNIAATYAIAEATDNLIEELKIPEDYWMTLQIGSKKTSQRWLNRRNVESRRWRFYEASSNDTRCIAKTFTCLEQW